MHVEDCTKKTNKRVQLFINDQQISFAAAQFSPAFTAVSNLYEARYVHNETGSDCTADTNQHTNGDGMGCDHPPLLGVCTTSNKIRPGHLTKHKVTANMLAETIVSAPTKCSGVAQLGYA